MDSQTFNSDSTYCSLYENFGNSIILKLNDSEFLEEVHNKIILHWEGRKLIGRIEAHSYMKKIAKMRFETYKDQYFAQKIQMSLLKIFKLIKKFEGSTSLNHLPKSLPDPINICSLTQDLKVAKKDIDPKQFLLGTTSMNTDKSFPLDILTNNNFEILASNLNRFIEPMNVDRDNQTLNTNKTSSYMENKYFTTSLQNHNQYPGSVELFSLENEKACNIENDINILKKHEAQSYLPASNIIDSDEPAPSKRKCITNISNKEMNIDEITSSQNLANDMEFEIINNTSNDYIKQSSSVCLTSEIKEDKICDALLKRDEIFKKLSDTYDAVSQQIVPCYYKNGNDIVTTDKHGKVNKECDNTSSEVFVNSEISETYFPDDDQSLKIKGPEFLKTINSNQLVAVRNLFKETYNKKINDIICYVDNESEPGNCWQRIQKEFEQKATMVREVNHTLGGLFEKLSCEEREDSEKHFVKTGIYKEGHFHKFSLEDEKKLDLPNLFKINKDRLEEISAEFKEKLKSNIQREDNESGDDTDTENIDYEGLDWRKVLKN